MAGKNTGLIIGGGLSIFICCLCLISSVVIGLLYVNGFFDSDKDKDEDKDIDEPITGGTTTGGTTTGGTTTNNTSGTPGVVEGRYIKLTRTNNENKPLNISEISVFDASDNKITQLTGSLSPVSTEVGWMGPELLFNNNLDDFAHTGDSTTASITVDLGSDKKIKKIVINNRKDTCCSDRIIGTTLTVQKADQIITFKKNINSVQAEFIFTNLDTTSDTI